MNEENEFHFTAIGDPAPKGSKHGFVVNGKSVLVEQSKRAKPWEQTVHWAARECADLGGLYAMEGPVQVDITFLMPRVGSVPKKARLHPHVKRPDADKLARLALDGLTGVCYQDDSQVYMLHVYKRYADPGESPGAIFVVRGV